MPTPDRNYLIGMFFAVGFCSFIIGLAGFGIIKTRYKMIVPTDYDFRDGALIGIALCFAVQAIHYWLQAHAVPFGAQWVSVVRAASTVIPILFVIYIVNGRITRVLNTISKRCDLWKSKTLSFRA